MMAKAPKGSSSTATKTKAGKKAGAYVEPPAPNKEKQKRSEAGRQQFVAKQQLTEPAVKTTFNKKTFKFEERLVEVAVPFIWDETRGQFVYSPTKENSER
jgi:hypothetical protein